MYDRAQQDFKEKETALDAMAGDGGYSEGTRHGYLASVMRRNGKRFWAGDNISEYIDEPTKQELIAEATEAFEKVLDCLLIDRETDPNSKGTAKRLAKMYFNEIMEVTEVDRSLISILLLCYKSKIIC